MSETLDDQQDCSSERLGLIGAICIGLVFGWLLALPVCFLSLQRGIAVGLIFTPLFTLLAYCLGGFIPFVQYMGLMLATFVLVTIRNAFHGLIPVERLIPSDTDSEAVDSATQAELETKAKILETDSETEFDCLANILRARDRFVRNRRKVLVIGATIAAIGTGFIQWDAMQLRERGDSTLVPASWKGVEVGALYYTFPVIFVAFSVPLCMVFASYPLWYVLACVAGSLYFGTAFYLLFQASSPELPFWILPLAILVVFAGLGLAADWSQQSLPPKTLHR